MSGVPYPYENDAGLRQGLSNRIRLERAEDLASYVGYVLHDSAWWRVLGSAPTEGAHGIFSLQLEEAGGSYYVPVDPEYLPGAASSWGLYPGRDLVLDWSPVGVFSLLSHMEAVHAEV